MSNRQHGHVDCRRSLLLALLLLPLHISHLSDYKGCYTHTQIMKKRLRLINQLKITHVIVDDHTRRRTMQYKFITNWQLSYGYHLIFNSRFFRYKNIHFFTITSHSRNIVQNSLSEQNFKISKFQ